MDREELREEYFKRFGKSYKYANIYEQQYTEWLEDKAIELEEEHENWCNECNERDTHCNTCDHTYYYSGG